MQAEHFEVTVEVAASEGEGLFAQVVSVAPASLPLTGRRATTGYSRSALEVLRRSICRQYPHHSFTFIRR